MRIAPFFPRALTGPVLLFFLSAGACSTGREQRDEDVNDESACEGPTCGTGATGASASGAGGSGTGGHSGEASGGEPGASTGGVASAYKDCSRQVDPTTHDFARVVPSQTSPIPVVETPLFVALGFDDNPESSGMEWTLNMLAEQGVKATFFHTSSYAPEALSQWRQAVEAGHEVALHTVNHGTSYQSSEETWSSETAGCIGTLTAPFPESGLGVSPSEIFGSRAPFLEFNDGMLSALDAHGIWYDSSIQEGFDASQDGTNFYFPYTLDQGSPGHTFNKSFGFLRSQFDLTPHPGLFELPVYALIVPPDSEATALGFEAGLRSRISVDDFVETGYRITGFDYNLWIQAGVTGAEFLAILKHNLHLRLAGNRAPLLFGVHSDQYSGETSRQQALSDFVTYAKSIPEVRIVTYKQVFDFMREPKALSCY